LRGLSQRDSKAIHAFAMQRSKEIQMAESAHPLDHPGHRKAEALVVAVQARARNFWDFLEESYPEEAMWAEAAHHEADAALNTASQFWRGVLGVSAATYWARSKDRKALFSFANTLMNSGLSSEAQEELGQILFQEKE
jgi:hypothetical protein